MVRSAPVQQPARSPVVRPLIHVAPMQCYTNRHFRRLLRLLSAQAVLWTEMEKVSDVLAHPERLANERSSGPLVLQLGGNDPEQLRVATDTAFTYNNSNWSEINLNCGCPSERVCDTQFGAMLMHEPETVRACVSEMARASRGAPVTVKCRLGTDKLSGYDNLKKFVGTVSTGIF